MRAKLFSCCGGAAIVPLWEGHGKEASQGGETARVALCQAVPVCLLNTFVPNKLAFTGKPGEKNIFTELQFFTHCSPL